MIAAVSLDLSTVLELLSPLAPGYFLLIASVANVGAYFARLEMKSLRKALFLISISSYRGVCPLYLSSPRAHRSFGTLDLGTPLEGFNIRHVPNSRKRVLCSCLLTIGAQADDFWPAERFDNGVVIYCTTRFDRGSPQILVHVFTFECECRRYLRIFPLGHYPPNRHPHRLPGQRTPPVPFGLRLSSPRRCCAGKNVSFLAASASRAAIHNMLAAKGNLADVTAKAGAQTIVACMVGERSYEIRFAAVCGVRESKRNSARRRCQQ